MKNDRNSFRNFPADLILATGSPFIILALVISWLLSLHGWPWIVAYSCTLFIALAGAVYLFRAKLPLYRERRFFTFGSRHLPPPSIPLYRLDCRLINAGIILAVMLLAISLLWRGC